MIGDRVEYLVISGFYGVYIGDFMVGNIGNFLDYLFSDEGGVVIGV